MKKKPIKHRLPMSTRSGQVHKDVNDYDRLKEKEKSEKEIKESSE